ncbi:MAG: saccharopine dehydrogenase family protein [Myxococcota bacterium]
MSTLLVYGAYGYTGELIARCAVEDGARPVLAGRSADRLRPLAEDLGCEARVFALDDPDAVDAGLEGIDAVLHCAGPFHRTSAPMVEACLRTRTHYLDITGEVEVFEAIAARDAEARDAGVMLMPGTGFDVVPTDCLAAHLKRRLPGAVSLDLAFAGLGGGLSHGTATTMIENLHRGNVVRRGGVLRPVPAGRLTRRIDFGRGPRLAMAIPWGDVSTAWFSTGIPDVTVYVPANRRTVWGARAVGRLGGLVGSAPVQRLLKRVVDARVTGPTLEQRERGATLLWGEARDETGHRVATRMKTPEGYRLTTLAALHIADKVLSGDVSPGFRTPSAAYGADLVLELPGVERADVA